MENAPIFAPKLKIRPFIERPLFFQRPERKKTVIMTNSQKQLIINHCSLRHPKSSIQPKLSTILDLFMQNEPNFEKVKFDVTKEIIKDYEQMDTWCDRKNEPKTNPIKAKTNPIRTQNEANFTTPIASDIVEYAGAKKRRGRDSNPRYPKRAHRFSKPARSATPTPLRKNNSNLYTRFGDIARILSHKRPFWPFLFPQSRPHSCHIRSFRQNWLQRQDHLSKIPLFINKISRIKALGIQKCI